MNRAKVKEIKISVRNAFGNPLSDEFTLAIVEVFAVGDSEFIFQDRSAWINVRIAVVHSVAMTVDDLAKINTRRRSWDQASRSNISNMAT